MGLLENGTVIEDIAFNLGSSIIQLITNRLSQNTVVFSFSTVTIDADTIRIQGAIGSDLIYASLLKIANNQYIVDEIFYR